MLSFVIIHLTAVCKNCGYLCFRAIFLPFKPRLRTRSVICVTIIIAVCSLAPSAYVATTTKLTRIHEIVRNTPVYHDICKVYENNEQKLIYILIIYTIGVWVPIVIILVVHIAMYIKLHQQSRIRAQHTTTDTTAQMRRTLKIFVIVVFAFIICILPLTVFECIIIINRDYFDSIPHLNKAHAFSIPLCNLNSCLNPLIYAKIHSRIYKSIRWVWSGISRYSTECNRCTRSSDDSHPAHQMEESRCKEVNNDKAVGMTEHEEIGLSENSLPDINSIRNPVSDVHRSQVGHENVALDVNDDESDPFDGNVINGKDDKAQSAMSSPDKIQVDIASITHEDPDANVKYCIGMENVLMEDVITKDYGRDRKKNIDTFTIAVVDEKYLKEENNTDIQEFDILDTDTFNSSEAKDMASMDTRF